MSDDGASGADESDASPGRRPPGGRRQSDGEASDVPPPPGVPDATAIGTDVLRGHADGLETRVDALAGVAEDAREAYEPPADPDSRAMAYCRHGLWPVLAVYVDRRSAGARLGQPHHDRLETALNTWLELYARCYDEWIDPDVSVREAAELFVSTHNVRDVALLLTDVPDR